MATADLRPVAPPDLAAGDLRPAGATSCCGEPGDPGNPLGVGRYCRGLSDCEGNSKASICSSLGNSQSSQSFFCTFLCDPNLGDSACGAGARCQCDLMGGGCACTPLQCAAAQSLGCGSCCGLPGDRGNELGVGKFCRGLSDCAENTRAQLCSTLGNSAERKTYFCTLLCDPAKGDAPCGTGAACRCDQLGGCACTPQRCLQEAPARCMN